MQRGSTITVFSNGFKVSEENLANIGIFDGSTCWGLWVPDRTQWPSRNVTESLTPEHFMVSPFEYSSWPILFRVEMFLNSDKPEALSDALEPLARNGFSILSIEVAPAGHHHSVVTIIGEAMRLKESEGVLKFLKRLPEQSRTFRQKKTWEYVHNVYAPVMLGYSQELTQAVELADGQNPFLREIFLDSNHKRYKPGVLYSYKELKGEREKKLGQEQRTPAVRCTWLQNLAFFWLYGRGDAIALNYEKRSQSLKPTTIHKHIFNKKLESFDPPFKSIASFNLKECFLRIVFSKDDLPQRTARVTIPFKATYPAYSGSKGFQQNLYKLLKEKCGLSLRAVSMSTQHRNLQEEIGTLSILVTKSEPDSKFEPEDDTRRKVQEIANKAAKDLEAIRCQMICEPVNAEILEAPLVFCSTNFDWMHNHHPDLPERIETIAKEVGFRLIMGNMDRRAEYESIVPEIANEPFITGATIKLIQHANAFIQVIPKNVLKKASKGSSNWLEFEFGAAYALGIPCAVLVDLDGGDIIFWKKHLRVANDFPLFGFNGSSNDQSFDSVIKKAIFELGDRRRRAQIYRPDPKPLPDRAVAAEG